MVSEVQGSEKRAVKCFRVASTLYRRERSCIEVYKACMGFKTNRVPQCFRDVMLSIEQPQSC